MKFKDLAVYLERLEKTSSRIEITKILAEIFKKSGKDEIDKITYLLLGRLAPSYKNIVFNLAERMMVTVLAKAYGIEKKSTYEVYKKEGDLGDIAALFATRNTQHATRHLSVTEVFNQLLKIANDEGEGSQERKITGMAKVLSGLDPLSARFVARIPVGKLRLGFSDKTVLDALSWMETGSKSKSKSIEAAYNVLPDVGLLAKNVKMYGIEKAVEKVEPVIGVPLLPMLTQRLKSPKEMIEKMGKVLVEPKFDGLRIQIHYKKSGFRNGNKSEAEFGAVKAFTRNLNETSWMFPELKGLEKYVKADEIILDSEAMGVDEKRQSLANFQTTMTRRRKHDIEKFASRVSIKFYVFDVLYKNGKNLTEKKYEERRNILAGSIKSGKLLELVDCVETDSPKTINGLMIRHLKEGVEGIVVKRADSKYVAGRTGWRWVKMKEEEAAKAKLADTLDCVVMGFTRGKGKRAEFGIGQFLAGVVEKNEIRTITKVGTGLTDDQFRELNKRLSKAIIKEKPKEYKVHKDLEPDFWVEPNLVVELAADEITKSPNHTSGLALRFPRLVKFRDDKSPKEGTTVSEVNSMFKLQ